MRQAHIFYKDQLAGILTENDAGYEFCYLPEYLSLEKAKAVSMTLPLQADAYISPVLFPFFDGLITCTDFFSTLLKCVIFIFAAFLSM